MLFLFIFLAANEVSNGLAPVKPQKISLVHELTLGTEDGGDDQIFSGTTTVTTDSAGNMYVNDPGSYRVAVFDTKGQFVKQFGKKGPGPGEFDEPVAVASDKQNRIYVFDTGHKKMTIFEPDGTVKKEIRFNAMIQGVANPHVLANGNIIFSSFQTLEGSWVHNQSLYDEELKVITKLSEVSMGGIDFSHMEQPGFWRDLLVAQFHVALKGLPVQASIGGDKLFVGQAHRYDGRILAAGGKELIRVSKENKPAVFSEEARFAFCEGIWEDLSANPFLTPRLTKPVFERALAKTEFPPGLPAMSGVCSFAGGFAVLSGYDLAKHTGRLDFFDAKGTYTATTPYSGPFKYIYGSHDKIYTVGIDDNDAVVVNVYRVNKG